MKFFENRWFLLSLHLALGGLFLYAGATKIGSPQAFADSIASFKLFPAGLVNFIALALPPFEIALGCLLIAGLRVRAASLGAAVLACVFAVALGQALARGLSVDCGCFGSGAPSLLKTWASFLRAFLLLFASIWLWRRGGLQGEKMERKSI